MSGEASARGGATVAVLNRLDAWEAAFIVDLRLWCEGARGQAEVRNGYRRALSRPGDERAYGSFEMLMTTMLTGAYRPLVRHDVGCGCVGADECVVVNLVRMASDGYLADAALVATLITGPARAEHIACLAGTVGETLRRIHGPEPAATATVTALSARLH